TLLQHQPDPEVVRQTIPLLEKYYFELKESNPTIALPPRLFTEISPVDTDHPFADISITSIQPGIAIMRLGAVLKQHLDMAGVTWCLGTTIQDCTVGIQKNQWVVDSNHYDLIINATNGNYPQVSQYLNTSPAVRGQHHIKNHRYQLYLHTKIPRPIPPTLKTGPAYTLCTTNSANVTSGFYGTMVDRTSLRTDPVTGELSSCFVLYAAGPAQNGVIGGGSWGKTGSPLSDPNWKGTTAPTTVGEHIIRSVESQFSELGSLEKKVALLHDGYNINIDTPGHRSDIRPFSQPEVTRETPIEITTIGAKFTHSPTSALETSRLVVDTLSKLGQIDSKSQLIALRRLGEFRIGTHDKNPPKPRQLVQRP
ncbi:hypothetical protein EBR57_10165, partial [bacterium]|nr:hypothetical protein [bacterium]